MVKGGDILAVINPVNTQTITNVASITPEVASTREGTNRYDLPKYTADSPEWLKPWNNLMSAIDGLMDYLSNHPVDHNINGENTYITINFSVTHTNKNTRSRPSININIID